MDNASNGKRSISSSRLPVLHWRKLEPETPRKSKRNTVSRWKHLGDLVGPAHIVDRLQ